MKLHGKPLDENGGIAFDKVTTQTPTNAPRSITEPVLTDAGNTPMPGTCSHAGQFFDADTLTCTKYELATANARLARLRELAKAILHDDADERGDAEDALRAELERRK